MNQVGVGERATVGLGAVMVKDVADRQAVTDAKEQEVTDLKATRAALAELAYG